MEVGGKKGFGMVGFVSAADLAVIEEAFRVRLLAWLGRELQVAKNTRVDCMREGREDSSIWWEGYAKALEDVKSLLEEGLP